MIDEDPIQVQYDRIMVERLVDTLFEILGDEWRGYIPWREHKIKDRFVATLMSWVIEQRTKEYRALDTAARILSTSASTIALFGRGEDYLAEALVLIKSALGEIPVVTTLTRRDHNMVRVTTIVDRQMLDDTPPEVLMQYLARAHTKAFKEFIEKKKQEGRT